MLHRVSSALQRSQAVAGAETSRAALARHEETGPMVKLYSATTLLFQSDRFGVWMTQPTISKNLDVFEMSLEAHISDE
jgi:hypothetical protein